MTKLAIFASGSGTNAENLIKHFKNSQLANITLVLSNNKNAQVLQRAKKHDVKTLIFSRKELYETDYIVEILKEKADFIILAGFLWRIPRSLIEAYPDGIVNIHPALLPKYGGKGMYGMRVHETVKENGEKESGISVHYVNERYDEGNIICQKKISIIPEDSPNDIAAKIHQLEYKYFPIVIENLLRSDNKLDRMDF